MRTSKPISTISYNTNEFLVSKLEELVRNHKISDYIFIHHFAEEDEKKDHTHLWVKPNTLVDTMDLQKFLTELDPFNPTKPFKCIDFVPSQIDDWILYTMHYEPYLASKMESRQFHYTKDEFVAHDEDTLDEYYNHALKGSEWAKRNQILQALNNNQISPTDLILNGTIPLNMASQLNAFKFMQRNYNTTNRGGRPGHEEEAI